MRRETQPQKKPRLDGGEAENAEPKPTEWVSELLERMQKDPEGVDDRRDAGRQAAIPQGLQDWWCQVGTAMAALVAGAELPLAMLELLGDWIANNRLSAWNGLLTYVTLHEHLPSEAELQQMPDQELLAWQTLAKLGAEEVYRKISATIISHTGDAGQALRKMQRVSVRLCAFADAHARALAEAVRLRRPLNNAEMHDVVSQRFIELGMLRVDAKAAHNDPALTFLSATALNPFTKRRMEINIENFAVVAERVCGSVRDAPRLSTGPHTNPAQECSAMCIVVLFCEPLIQLALNYHPWLRNANLYDRVLDMCEKALNPADAANGGNSAPFASQLQIRYRRRDGLEVVVPSDADLVRAAEHVDTREASFKMPENCSHLSYRLWHHIEVVLLGWELASSGTTP